MTETDLTTLLAAAARNDQAAWEELVRRFTGYLWSIARGFGLDQAAAGDAVQTTWLRLVDNLDRVTDPERLAGWLGTTMRRECLRLAQRRSREEPASTPDWLDNVPSSDHPIDAGLLEEERNRALWRAFDQLNARCQHLLRVLAATPPPSYAIVSAALDLPIGSIGPTRQRCLRRLRAIVLSDQLLIEPDAQARP